MEKFRVQLRPFSVINLSGEVQSEHFTEENTCMTSSEDNQVCIPPNRSGFGLTDDRSCVSSQYLELWIYTGFSAGNQYI